MTRTFSTLARRVRGTVSLATASTLCLGAMLATGCADQQSVTAPADLSLRAAKTPPPPPGPVANLAGSWTQTPKDSVSWFDGVSVRGFMRRWYVLTAQQNGTAIKGNGNGFVQYFLSTGAPYTGVVSTGGGLKFSGTVNGTTEVTLGFDGTGETKVISTATFAISADANTLTKVSGATGFRMFTR